jgi:hypothetical protein
MKILLFRYREGVQKYPPPKEKNLLYQTSNSQYGAKTPSARHLPSQFNNINLI